MSSGVSRRRKDGSKFFRFLQYQLDLFFSNNLAIDQHLQPKDRFICFFGYNT